MKSLLIRQKAHSEEIIIKFKDQVELSNILQSKVLLGSLDQATALICWSFFSQGFKSVVIDGSAVYELTEIIEESNNDSPTVDQQATDV